MRTQSHASQHPIERPECFRVLFDWCKLPREDLFELSLVNKTCFKLLTWERYRHNVRTVPFLDSDSLFCRAIDQDTSTRLAKWLEMGEFAQDPTSPNSRLLHANRGQGIHLLMGACIKKGAGKCLKILMRWADQPTVPFSYNRMWVYNRVEHVAQRYSMLTCLFMLHDRDKDGHYPDPTGLYTNLLLQTRSPSAVVGLAKRLPDDTEFLPALLAQCKNRHSQPAVIEMLLEKVPKYTFHPSGHITAVNHLRALSTAAGALHITALELLLHSGGGVRAFDPTHLTSPSHNPLLACLTQRLPTNPSTHPSPNCTPIQPFHLPPPHLRRPSERDMRLHEWRVSVHKTATLMRSATASLVRAARNELSAPKHQEWLREMLDRAALTFVFVLRAWLLANITWLLSEWECSERLDAADVGRRTKWNVGLWEEDEDWAVSAAVYSYGEGEDECQWGGEAALGYTWKRGLLGWKVRDALKREGVELDTRLVDIWKMLATTGVVTKAKRYLRVWEGFEAIGDRWDSADGLWELLVARERLEGEGSSRVRETGRDTSRLREIGRETSREKGRETGREKSQGSSRRSRSPSSP